MTTGYAWRGECYETNLLAMRAMGASVYPLIGGTESGLYIDRFAGMTATPGTYKFAVTYVSAGGSVSKTRSYAPWIPSCVVEDAVLPEFRLAVGDFGLVASSLAALVLAVHSWRYVAVVLSRFRDPA